MRIFFILLKKEIKEMLTIQLIVSLAAMLFIFHMIGSVVGKQTKASAARNNVVVLDFDKSELSKRIIKGLADGKYMVKDASAGDLADALSNHEYEDESFFMVIGKGLERNFKLEKKHTIEVYARFSKSLSGYSSSFSAAKIRKAIGRINKDLGVYALEKKFPSADVEFMKKPVLIEEFVVIGNARARVSVKKVLAFVRSQTYFFPIAVFFLVFMAAQMIMTAIAGEKENKTLETLLSSPIDRKALIMSKLSAAAIIAVLLSGGYMLGMRSFMSGIMGQAALGSALFTQDAFIQLGLVISAAGYLMIGISVLFCILCALAIALILGVLSEDVKSVGVMITPLMMLIMISYLLPMFIDIGDASFVIKLLLYAIPFTHAFIAPQNILVQNYSAVMWGIVYQAVVFGVFVAIAGKIFSGEALLTFKLRFGKSK
ncbi:MAG: ABC transporter permease [Elusimicrobiales bacterium]|nr:ABC transporter permease [Elusimicrobiales bacterium]